MSRLLTAIAVAVLFVALPVRADLASSPVHFAKLIVTPSPAHPDEVVRVEANAVIENGWHVYSIVPSAKAGPFATKVTLTGANLGSAGGPTEDTVTAHYDPNFQTAVAYHVRTASFVAYSRILKSAPFGIVNANLTIRYQACNDQVCDPPQTFNAPIKLTITQGAVRAGDSADGPSLPAVSSAPANSPDTSIAVSSAPTGPTSPSALTDLWGFIAVAFLAGLGALVTPCVFPLIPVTFGYFTKESGGEHKKLVALAGAYILGIIVAFVALGLVATVALGAAGPNRVAANPWINLGFGILFAALAFAFFETFNLALPSGLQTIAAGARGKGGLVGVLMMGLAFVFTAFTCTAPFIATILATAASSTGAAGYARPALGMTVFAIALSLPFFLISLFPPLLTKLPKSGAWLSRMKAVLGFVELAYAVLYFSKADLVWQAHIFTRPMIFGIWAAIAVCGALYLIGALKVNRYPDEACKLTVGRGLGIAAFVAVAGYCFYALTGRPINKDLAAFVPEPSYGYGAIANTTGALTWSPDFAASADAARRDEKPIFIDFTGYTCTNCRWMELNIFTKPEVQNRLAKFDLVKLYTDGGVDADKNQALQLKIGQQIAQPLYAILQPDGTRIAVKLGVERNPAAFAAFLDQALSSAQAVSSQGPASSQQPDASTSQPVVTPKTAWAPYTASAYAAALAAHQPTVIDFTASWCVPCHAIERTVFEQPTVAAKLSSFTTLRADLTNFDAPPNTAIEQQFGVTQLPSIVIIDATGKEVPGTRVTGILTANDFLARLSKAQP